MFQIYPGFTSAVFDTLSLKVKGFSDASKQCAIIMDEMSIKESLNYNSGADMVEGFEDFGNMGRTKFISNHAIAFLVRGLCEKWKQPLGYFLSSGPMEGQVMSSLLKECISKVQFAGLHVKVVIGDQGSNNRSLFHKALGATAEEPYFFYEGKKIYLLYDPPHLIKNVRNNLKKQGFNMADKTISWQYIEDFFNMDSRLPIRMAPRLTAKHIQLPPFASLRVRYATQVLSHTVASGIMTMVSLGALPSEAQATAEFIDRMDQLFNCFNSQTLHCAAPMRNAITEKSAHMAFLQDTKDWLGTVSATKGRKLPCLEGWTMAINCLTQLWTDLHTQHGYKFLLTNRLNQDCVENLFSVIRGKGRQRDNPDPLQFRTAFRQVPVDALMVPSKSANCQEDVDAFLFTLGKKDAEPTASAVAAAAAAEGQDFAGEDLTSMLEIPDAVKSLMSVMILPKEANTDEQLSTQERNVLTYIAGYVIRKVKGKVCNQCYTQIAGTLEESNEDQTFIAHKQYSYLKTGGLTVPREEFKDVLCQIETKFREVAPAAIHQDKVRIRILSAISKLPCVTSLYCTGSGAQRCALDKVVISLYVTMRLHFALKLNNQALTTTGMRRNRKTLKFSHL